MSDKNVDSVSAEEIREWEEEHDEPHPIFDVPYRPERISLLSEEECDE